MKTKPILEPVEIHNTRQSIALLEEQLVVATEPYLVRQLTKLINEYRQQIQQYEQARQTTGETK